MVCLSALVSAATSSCLEALMVCVSSKRRGRDRESLKETHTIRASKQEDVAAVEHAGMPEALARVGACAVYLSPFALAVVVDVHVVAGSRALTAKDHEGILVQHCH